MEYFSDGWVGGSLFCTRKIKNFFRSFIQLEFCHSLRCGGSGKGTTKHSPVSGL